MAIKVNQIQVQPWQKEYIQDLPRDELEAIIQCGKSDREAGFPALQPGSFLYMLGYRIDSQEVVQQKIKELIK